MIVGIGVDIVNVAKLGATIEMTPGYAEAVFTPSELLDEAGDKRTHSSLAGRFAAKEAVAKALGAPPGMSWLDAEVMVEPDGRPYLVTRGELGEAARLLGVECWHLSLAMEGDFAIAYVIAEGASSLAGVPRARMVEIA